MDFLNKLNQQGNHQNQQQQHQAPPQQSHGGEGGDLFSKLGGVLGSGNHQQQHQAPPQQSHSGGGGDLFGKLGGVLGGGNQQHAQTQQKPQGFGDKLNGMFGGGHAGEQKEDGLDKAIDYVQEHVFKQGQQSNESAIEQMKDKQIADALRTGFKNTTGHNFPGSGSKH